MKSKILIGLFLILALFIFGCAGGDIAEEEVEVPEEDDMAEVVANVVIDTGYIGSWKHMGNTIDGEFNDASMIGSTQIFTSTTFVAYDGLTDCTTSGTIEVIGNEMIMTTTDDGCYSLEGMVLPYEYSISGDELTLTGGDWSMIPGIDG